MAQSTDNTGALIQEQVADLLVKPLEAESVVLNAGPRTFDTSEPLRIPKITSTFDPEFTAENEEINSDDSAEFDEVRLMPSDRKSLKSIVRFSNEALRQTTVGLDQVLKERLVTDVASKLDDALLTGDGSSHTITGITEQSGTQSAELDAGDPDSFLDAIGKAQGAHVEPDRWFLNTDDFIKLRKTQDEQGRYLLESDLTADATYRLFGIKVVVTSRLDSGTALLCDMDKIAVARDVDASVTLLSERYAEYDQQAIRVVTRYDLGLLHPEAVVVLTASES